MKVPTKRKDGRWQTFVDLGKDEDNKRIRIPVYGYTSAEAKAKKAEIETDISKGNFAMPSKLTVGGYIDKWIDIHSAMIEKTTVEAYGYNIKHIKKHIGDKKLQELKPIDIQQFYSKLLKDHSPNTIKKIHVVLRKALDMALKSNMITRNPADAVDIPRKERYNAGILSEEKFKELMDKVNSTIMEMPVILAGGLGLRKGEVLGLKWQDIDIRKCLKCEGNGIITIKKKKVICDDCNGIGLRGTLFIKRSLARIKGEVFLKEPKNETSRRKIIIPSNTIPFFEKHRKWQFEHREANWIDNDLVVCWPNGKWIRPDNFSEKFKKLFVKGEEIRFHDLRHFNATMMLRLGVSDKMAAARLGHKQVATLNEIYQHVMEDIEKEAADKLNALYSTEK